MPSPDLKMCVTIFIYEWRYIRFSFTRLWHTKVPTHNLVNDTLGGLGLNDPVLIYGRDVDV